MNKLALWMALSCSWGTPKGVLQWKDGKRLSLELGGRGHANMLCKYTYILWEFDRSLYSLHLVCICMFLAGYLSAHPDPLYEML